MIRVVGVRDLRNSGAEVLTRVMLGERLVVTRDGAPVAELRPLSRTSLAREQLVARRRKIPPVDLERLRRDLAGVLDDAL
jgi:prevent-host-death family protein